jgi:hypothetical protein
VKRDKEYQKDRPNIQHLKEENVSDLDYFIVAKAKKNPPFAKTAAVKY